MMRGFWRTRQKSVGCISPHAWKLPLIMAMCILVYSLPLSLAVSVEPLSGASEFIAWTILAGTSSAWVWSRPQTPPCIGGGLGTRLPWVQLSSGNYHAIKQQLGTSYSCVNLEGTGNVHHAFSDSVTRLPVYEYSYHYCCLNTHTVWSHYNWRHDEHSQHLPNSHKNRRYQVFIFCTIAVL